MSIFKRFMSGNEADNQPVEIAIGDKFAHVGNSRTVWVVDKIHDHNKDIKPLVTMYREGHPDLLKVLSTTALSGESDYLRC